jgi:hypothetical protein
MELSSNIINKDKDKASAKASAKASPSIKPSNQVQNKTNLKFEIFNPKKESMAQYKRRYDEFIFNLEGINYDLVLNFMNDILSTGLNSNEYHLLQHIKKIPEEFFRQNYIKIATIMQKRAPELADKLSIRQFDLNFVFDEKNENNLKLNKISHIIGYLKHILNALDYNIHYKTYSSEKMNEPDSGLASCSAKAEQEPESESVIADKQNNPDLCKVCKLYYVKKIPSKKY